MSELRLNIDVVEANTEYGKHAHDDTENRSEPESTMFHSDGQGSYVRSSDNIVVEIIKYKVYYQAAPYCNVVEYRPMGCI